MGLMKKVAIDLMNNFGTITYNQLIDYILPKKCYKCHNEMFDLSEITEKEVIYKCRGCGDLISIDYEENNFNRLIRSMEKIIFQIAEYHLKQLLSYYKVNLMEFKRDIIPKDCFYCDSKNIKFNDFTKEEALWKCEKCEKTMAIPYDFRNSDRKLRMYFSS